MKESIYSDGSYLNQNPNWHQNDSHWKAEKILELFQRNQLKPLSVSEIGCGAGEILNYLSEKLPATTNFSGFEISPQAYELCRSKEKPNLNFQNIDLLKDNHNKFFNVIMAIDVFEHVEDYFGFIRRLKQIAEYQVFHIPLDLSVQSLLRNKPILKLRSTIGHLHYFTTDTALATLNDCGFEILDYFYTASAIELSNRGWKANLLKIPRKLLFKLNADLTVRILGGYSLMVLTR